MADDASIAAMEMANLALATAAADAAILPAVPGVDAAVATPPVVSQHLPAVGEPFVVPELPVAPTASAAIHAAGLRVAASAARIPAASPVTNVLMHEAGTSSGTVGRHEFNRQWHSNANSYSKERKYDGLSLLPQKQDQKTRFNTYCYNVASCINLCQGPRHDQESINMVESQCAILHTTDGAHKVVVDFFNEHQRDPLKAELFHLLEQQFVGSVSGDLTITEKIDAMHCDDLTRTLQASLAKGLTVVDLPSVLNLAKAELKLRPDPFDRGSHVLWILKLFKDLSRGENPNPDLAAIRKTARFCLSDGVKVEQMDPIAMMKSVASCGIAWDLYYSTVLSGGGSGGNGGHGGSGGSGGSRGTGGSTGGRPGKRPFTSTDQNVGRLANGGGGRQPAGGGAARQPFDPFVSIPNQCHLEKSDANKKWFVRGQTGEQLTSLMREGKCVLC